MTELLHEDVSPTGYHPMALTVFLITDFSSFVRFFESFEMHTCIQIPKYDRKEIIIASHMKRYSLPRNQSIRVETRLNYTNLSASGHFQDWCQQSSTINYGRQSVSVPGRQWGVLYPVFP